VGPNQALISIFHRRGVYAFLLDTRTGESRRISGFAAFGSAADLKSGLLARVEEGLNMPKNGPGLLAERFVISSATSAAAPLVDRPVPERFRRFLDISEGGRLAIFSTAQGFEVIDTQTAATQFRYSASRVVAAAFQAGGAIAAFGEEGPSRIRFAIVASDGKVIRENRFPAATLGWGFMVHSDTGRVAVTDGENGVAIYERDGTPITRLAPVLPEASYGFRGKGSVQPNAVLFTRVGDFILAGGRGLRTVRHDETTVREVPLTTDGVTLPLAGDRSITGELASGEIAISQFVRGSFSTLLVDPLTGAVRLSLPGYRTIVRRGRGAFASASDRSEDSGLRLLQNEDGDLLFLDPGSTKPRLLVKSTKEDR